MAHDKNIAAAQNAVSSIRQNNRMPNNLTQDSTEVCVPEDTMKHLQSSPLLNLHYTLFFFMSLSKCKFICIQKKTSIIGGYAKT